MPVPIILWVVGATGAAYLAWKNREAVGEIVKEIGQSWARETIDQADYLVSASKTEAIEWLKFQLPNMDLLSRAMLVKRLAMLARENSKAEAIYSEALKISNKIQQGDGQPDE